MTQKFKNNWTEPLMIVSHDWPKKTRSIIHSMQLDYFIFIGVSLVVLLVTHKYVVYFNMKHRLNINTKLNVR